ncbi:hypothetical protein EVAR_26010_1 [Eumeta japonica]|uniref:Uncharacterized protein n=1 Tax=Eumeta variegata TaxID=151549 RepID=A0A4C1VQX9_EUMVA|nr:hypothetical protein EVAR_26010_1 [Eumeta japonica]
MFMFLVRFNLGLVFDSDPSHIYDSDPVPTLVFNPSPVLNFGSGLAVKNESDLILAPISDPGAVLDSTHRPAFDSDSATNHSSNIVRDEVAGNDDAVSILIPYPLPMLGFVFN